MKDLMNGTLDRSPALAGDRAFLSSLQDISAEAGLERLEDPILRSYTAVEDRLPSRMDQIAQAKARGLVGAVPHSEELTGPRLGQLAEKGLAKNAKAKSELERYAQRYSDYVDPYRFGRRLQPGAILHRQPAQALLLLAGNRLQCDPCSSASAKANLDEHQAPIVIGDDIDLAAF